MLVEVEKNEQRGDGEWLLNGCRFFFWGDENILELDRGVGCKTL